jgi:hypothetical protein
MAPELLSGHVRTAHGGAQGLYGKRNTPGCLFNEPKTVRD